MEFGNLCGGQVKFLQVAGLSSLAWFVRTLNLELHEVSS